MKVPTHFSKKVKRLIKKSGCKLKQSRAQCRFFQRLWYPPQKRACFIRGGRASHTRGLGIMSKNTYRTKLLQYDQHWELLHQTPMKKCPECHSKRPMSLGNLPPNPKKMSLHRLPKALNNRFHQIMIHQKSKGAETRRHLNTNLWASGYRPSPQRGFLRAQRRSPRAVRWRASHCRWTSRSEPGYRSRSQANKRLFLTVTAFSLEISFSAFSCNL